MKDFYLTLVSNAEKDDLIGDFHARLPSAIRLDRPYEVAICSIIYPSTYQVLTTRPDANGLQENELQVWIGDEVEPVCVHVPCGTFRTATELCRLLNYSVTVAVASSPSEQRNRQHLLALIANLTEAGEYDLQTGTVQSDQMLDMFSYSRITKHCTIKAVSEQQLQLSVSRVRLSSKLAYILGVDEEIYQFPHVGHHMTSTGTDFMYIYLNNLIEAQIYSNVREPIIRAVSLAHGNGENVEHVFTNPLYVPVRSQEFDQIWVQLKNDQNRVIDFQSGKVCIVLHFRRRLHS